MDTSGRLLLHYRILDKIGEGGMGTVYRATDTKLGRQVAIKVLPAEIATDRDRLERFRREAMALAALDHPGIVTVFSVEEANGTHFLTMQLVAGRSLDQLIAEGPLDASALLNIATRVADALAAAHDSGIVHRDLKPANVMVTPDSGIKVLDFGVARWTRPTTEGTAPEDLSTVASTRAGAVLGTPAYMSPEQLSGRAVDPRTDLFSLGVLLYEMATGERPFRGGSVAELSASLLRDVPGEVDRSDLPDTLHRVIRRCLEKDPDQRYATAREVIRDLEAKGIVPVSPASRRSAAASEANEAGSLSEHAIAVLPFDDLSAGEKPDWFAAGMHEALLTALQQIEGLQAISRTSVMQYRDHAMPLPQIVRELGVRWVVEGSVILADDRVRITAKLIDGQVDRQVWAEQFDHDLSRILEVQSRVATSVARRIDVVVRPREKRRLGTEFQVVPEAYGKYVLGLRHLDRVTRADFERSVACFEEAIALDPTFALPHAHLAVSFGIAIQYGWVFGPEVASRAERAASTALDLDPASGDAHYAQASVQRDFRRDFVAAEKSFHEALRLSSHSMIYFGYGWLLSQMGRHDEAVHALETAVRLDPRSPLMHGDLGWWLYGARRFDRAMEEARVAVTLDPEFAEGYWLEAAALAALGRFDESLTSFDRYETAYGEPVPWFRGYLYGLAGRRDDALAELTKEQAQVDCGRSSPIALAHVHLGLGDVEAVMRILEKATAAGVSFQPYLWPEYEPLIRTPEFRSILTKFGLPLPD